MTTQPAHIGAPVRRGLNGQIVLLSLLAFFGVIFFVNGIMIYMAISTLGGVETQSSYKAGQAFAADVEAAREQSERHWQVEEAVRRIDTDFVAISSLRMMHRPLPSPAIRQRLVPPPGRCARRSRGRARRTDAGPIRERD